MTALLRYTLEQDLQVGGTEKELRETDDIEQPLSFTWHIVDKSSVVQAEPLHDFLSTLKCDSSGSFVSRLVSPDGAKYSLAAYENRSSQHSGHHRRGCAGDL